MNFNMTREELVELGYEECVLLEPKSLDEAIIGITHDNRIIYEYEKLVKAFMEHDGMTNEEAVEWIDYNTIRSLPYIQNSPVIMYNFD